MLVELAVRNLGVIESLDLVFEPGMTALTGETGAGKTMVVEAIELLLGGRADAVLVRPGADGARVDGRFAGPDGAEVVLSRVVPANGRSRAYVNGEMAPVSALAEAGAGLVDLHGQNVHQQLLSMPAQRAALDAFGGVDLAGLHAARARVAELDEALADLGGDERSRAREMDLLRFQVAELDGAGLTDADEDARLEVEEDRLADATAHREAAAAAYDALAGEAGGVSDGLAAALSALQGRAPLAEVHERLLAVSAEADEAARDLRTLAEQLEDDPERLAAVRERRRLLHELRRKYGETLADVLAFFAEASDRLAELEGRDTRAAALDAERARAVEQVARQEAAVRAARQKAAPRLAAAVEERLHELAMPRARFLVEVGDDGPGDSVAFLLSANAGEPPLPLSKVASGGELARTMLAARLVLTDAPGTLVFDEVDAGIGGEAAVAVGRALAALAAEGRAQVLVVTHLPQVAAFADHQVAVWKEEQAGRTRAQAARLDEEGRVAELSRMLSGQPESETARGHAEELLRMRAR